VESLAVILLLALVIALIINYAHGGMPQVGQWLKAKYVGA
jgi:hypothetical protein